MKNLKKLSVLSLIAALLLSGCGRIGKDTIIDTPPTNDRVEIKTEGETSENVGSAADRFNNAGSESTEEEKEVLDTRQLLVENIVDLTAEPSTDVLNASWKTDDGFEPIDVKDLEMNILNRKVTLTGTKIGDFIETFKETQSIIDMTKLEFDKEIHPYQGVNYTFHFSGDDNVSLGVTAYNMTSDIIRMSDCVIYSLSLTCDDNITDYKVTHSLFDENGNYNTSYKDGSSDNFTYTVGVYESNSMKIYVEVNPLINGAVEDFVKSLSNESNYIVGDVEQTVGDSFITVLDYTIDLKKTTVADVFNMYDTQEINVLPKYEKNIYTYNPLTGNRDDVDYRLDGYSGFWYKFNGHDLFVNTSSIYDGNLYLAPINDVSIDINQLNNSEEFVSLAGFTNLDKQDDIVKIYNDSIKSNISFEMYDGSKDKLDFSVTVDDPEFLNMYINDEIPNNDMLTYTKTDYRYHFEFTNNKTLERIWFHRECDN